MSGRTWSFARWRHARPFWGALLITLSGAEILATVKAPLPVIVHVGMQGLAGMLVPLLLLLCGILLLINPEQRLFYSLVATVLTLASWITSNLGGFFVGLLLGLVGSALAFAWSPSKVRGGGGRKRREDDGHTRAGGGGRVPAHAGEVSRSLEPIEAEGRLDSAAVHAPEAGTRVDLAAADTSELEARVYQAPEPAAEAATDAEPVAGRTARSGQAVEPDDGLLDGRGGRHGLR
ncbi:DUF6114 domain-containing protein [Actinoplanes sp. TFC3]|uniref:DUF6114 domain-containing protein n=1 Tax=Actinoplanes sp. TFC3 TaxID=1710355 RepID=UPI00082F915B|nr:DUF6114 domain-containing protein [Actinoplanes sp. TFC3]